MNTGMIHRINLAGSLLAVSFLVPATMRGQAPQQPGQIQEIPAPNLKSEDTALWLSLGSTLLPVAAGAVMIAASDSEGSLSTAGAILVSSGVYFLRMRGETYSGVGKLVLLK